MAEDLERVARGEIYARRINVDELRALGRLAESNNRLVNNIEPYRLKDGLELAHVELTVTPGWFEEAHAALDPAERIEAAHEILERTIAETEAIDGDFIFWAGTGSAGF